MPACDQCGRPSLVTLADHPLCIGCYALLQHTETSRREATNDSMRLNMAHQNHLLSQMDWMFGMGSTSPKINVPAKPSPQYNTAVHNVNVEGGSTVGAITTGSVNSISAAIGTTQEQGNTELATALKAFTDALTSEPVADDQKKEMAEQLATLSEELTKPKEVRRRAVIVPMLDGLSKAVGVSAGLVDLWGKLHPLLTQAFS